MLRNSFLSFTLILAGAPWAAAGDAALDRAAREIDPVAAKHHVSFLAGDELEGRAAGSAGGRAAAGYIVRRLASYGLRPLGGGAGDDAWFQEFEHRGTKMRNIVALREGRDAARGHVVLGAHYDHVGRGENGGIPSLRDLAGRLFGDGERRGEVHNGADDNASGTAALLEIGKALGALDRPPERSVVLIFFDGEELGLLGALHYAEHPRLPLDRCAAMINLDMVGRARAGRVDLVAATSGRGLAETIIEENGAVGLDLVSLPYMVPNSDHFAFYGKNVPVAFFTTGLHADYHRPSDDWQKINSDDLARTARLAFRAAVRVAEEPLAPVFAKVEPAPVGALALEMLESLTGSSAFRELADAAYGPIAGAQVRLHAKGGLSVGYVAPRSPLAAAGIAPGDRLLTIDGAPLRGPLARLALRRALARPGAHELALERDGARRTVGVGAGAGAGARREREREPVLY